MTENPNTTDTLNQDGTCSYTEIPLILPPGLTIGTGGVGIGGALVIPAAVGGLIPVTGGTPRLIAAGIAHTCALTPEGGVQCWGNNDLGQLGDGTNKSSNVRVNVPGLQGATSIVAGGNHTCVLLADGSIWCWGENTQGQLGDGTLKNQKSTRLGFERGRRCYHWH